MIGLHLLSFYFINETAGNNYTLSLSNLLVTKVLKWRGKEGRKEGYLPNVSRKREHNQ